MRRTFSQAEYQQKIDLKHDGHIQIIKGYINTRTKCEFNDSRCDHATWLSTPIGVSRGRGCPSCGCVPSGKSKKLTQSCFQSKIDLKHNGHIQIVNGYTNTYTKCEFNDNRCEHDTWLAIPNNIASGQGCPTCAKNRNKLTESEYQAKIDAIRLHRGHVKIITGYVDSITKCEFNDDRCDHNNWLAKPSSILMGTGCPECNKFKRTRQKN